MAVVVLDISDHLIPDNIEVAVEVVGVEKVYVEVEVVGK